MSNPSTPPMPDENAPPKPLDTIFLTGPGGYIYEIPRKTAEKYVITLERLRELGHPPIVPYGTDITQASGANAFGGDVQGHNMVMLPSGVLGYHTDIRYGTFRGPDGNYYTGNHYHPYGTELGFTP